MFQSTPRFVGEEHRNPEHDRPASTSLVHSFNPPPALSARGTRCPGRGSNVMVVSIHPRFVGEGNVRSPQQALNGRREVSIHPPLCRRGERDRGPAKLDHIVSIHPPLCRRGERSDLAGTIDVKSTWRWFQSTPRFVGEGNARLATEAEYDASVFQSTPALSARGTWLPIRWLSIGRYSVSIHPPPRGRGGGTRVPACESIANSCTALVSIHPPLCRRGNGETGA